MYVATMDHSHNQVFTFSIARQWWNTSKQSSKLSIFNMLNNTGPNFEGKFVGLLHPSFIFYTNIIVYKPTAKLPRGV